MSKGDIVIEDCGSLPQLIRVELPCFMRDKDKVLECLGGEDIVNESLMGDSNFLHASLAPQESPPRYVFKAKPVISNGFLVRIRRKKKRSPSDNDNEATVSVLGHVAKSYIFDRPVGCQFLRSNPSSTFQSSDVKFPPQLDVAPHQFLGRYDKPAFDIFAAKANGVAYVAPLNKKRPIPIMKIVKYEKGMVIPSEKDMSTEQDMNEAFSKLRKHNKLEMKGILRVLKELLETLAMWTRPLLLDKLILHYPELTPQNIEVIFRQLLPLMAYFFTGGPWNNCWVRGGFDPTSQENNQSRFLQCVKFRYSTREFSSLLRSVSLGPVAGQRVVNLDTLQHDEYRPNMYLDHHFSDVIITAFGGVQITRQYTVQLKRLMSLPEFEEELKALPHLPTCTMNSNGWFSEHDIANLRIKIKEYILNRATAFFEKQSALQNTTLPSQSAAAIETSFLSLQQQGGKRLLLPQKGTGKSLKAVSEARENQSRKRDRSAEDSGAAAERDNSNYDLNSSSGATQSQQSQGQGLSLGLSSQSNSTPSWMASLSDVNAFDVFDDDDEDEDVMEEDEDDDDDDDDEGERDETLRTTVFQARKDQSSPALHLFSGTISNYKEI